MRLPMRVLMGRMGFMSRRPRLLSVVYAQIAAPTGVRRLTPSTRPSGGVMRMSGSSRSSEITRCADVLPSPPSWLRAFHPAWRALAGWPEQTSVGHGPTEFQRPSAGTRSGGSGDECGGRSRAVALPLAGGHRWRHRLPSRLPLPQIPASAVGRGRCIHPGHHGHPGCHTGRRTPCPKARH